MNPDGSTQVGLFKNNVFVKECPNDDLEVEKEDQENRNTQNQVPSMKPSLSNPMFELGKSQTNQFAQ